MVEASTRRPVVLVTGTAQGLGSVILEQFAAEGYDVIANDVIHDDRLEAVCARARARGVNAQALAQDISAIDDLGPFVHKATEAFGAIDCLVNNAGVSVLSRGDLLDVTPESFDRCMDINLRGTFFLTQHIARWMIANKDSVLQGRRRSIVTISSVGVDLVGRQIAEYCLSKTALAAMTRHFAVRLVEEGIDCYDVRPGMMQTGMTESSRERYDALIASDYVPARRWGLREEVAMTVTNLASGALRYGVGQSIAVDGGLGLKLL